jgi:hypothetical protein
MAQRQAEPVEGIAANVRLQAFLEREAKRWGPVVEKAPR